MSGYIQIAIGKIKTADLGQMRSLRKKGHRTIRFKLENEGTGKKKPATASVPIGWIVEARERWDLHGQQDDTAFKDFVSDWVTNWV